jgi:hypothetical protein
MYTRGKCVLFRFGRTCPKKRKEKEGNITLYNKAKNNKECDCFTTKQQPLA